MKIGCVPSLLPLYSGRRRIERRTTGERPERMGDGRGGRVNIFFDVDYTILSAQDTLRPKVKEVFEQIVADGHTLYVWSGMGLRWPTVRKFELEPLVSGVFNKPISDYLNGIEKFGVKPYPDFVIDDYPGIVECFSGMYCREYFVPDQNDDEMLQCYEIIKQVTETGTSDHPRWRRGMHKKKPATP
jgi:hypothetical protein